jgi:transcription antitermination factor NusG
MSQAIANISISNSLQENLSLWYALHTRSRFEKKLYNLFCKKNIQCYLPVQHSRRRWSDRIVELDLPLFPSYLFIKIEPKTERYYEILDTKGVVSILGNNGQPSPIPEYEIASIQKVLSTRSTVSTVPGLKKGTRVEVVSGPLTGVQGIVEGKGRHNRLFIVITSVGQSIIVDIDSADLQVI